MERCKTCKNYDQEKSSEQWVVCSCIPLDVMISGTSKECKNYEPIAKSIELKNV